MSSRTALEVIFQVTSKYLSEIRQMCSRYHFAPSCPVDHIQEYLMDWCVRRGPDCRRCLENGREINESEIKSVGPYIHMSISSGPLAPGHSSMDIPILSENQLFHIPSTSSPQQTPKIKELENTAQNSHKVFSNQHSAQEYSPVPETSPQRKVSGRPTKFPKMQDELCKWIVLNHRLNNQEPLKQKHLVAKASQLQRLFYPDQPFNASKGWFERFSQRHPVEFSYTMRHNKPRYIPTIRKKARRVRKEEQKELEINIEEQMSIEEIKSEGVFLEENVSEHHTDNDFKMAVKIEFNPDDCIM